MTFLRDAFFSVYYACISNVLFALIMGLNKTLNIRFTNPGMFRKLRHQKMKPIFAVWHQATFPLLYYYRHRGCAAFTSDGRRGEVLTRCAEKLGYLPVQVPYKLNVRESARAFLTMLKLLNHVQDAACVVDGPAGPCFMIKPGIFYLAAKSGRVIVPLSVHFNRKIRLLWRWDKYILPLPGSQVLITIGEPLSISSDQLEGRLPKLTHQLSQELSRTSGQ